MKWYCILTVLLFATIVVTAQTTTGKLAKAVSQLQAAPQMKHAVISLYVVNAHTGKMVYGLNEQTGLAPASTQKIFTSIAAFDLLGKDYRFKTEIGYSGTIAAGVLTGDLVVTGYGDPTPGSWRYAQTKREVFLNSILAAIKQAGISRIDGDIIADNSAFSYQPLPGGWIWDDIGNYYGAGLWGVNWNENQYDLLLLPGNKEGDSVKITGTNPLLDHVVIHNLLKTGKPGSGDNGYIYLPPYATEGFVEGTVPAGKKSFTLSGALPNPALQFAGELKYLLIQEKIMVKGQVQVADAVSKPPVTSQRFHTLYSPSLDSMNYFFLQKSINLYGEALARAMAYTQTGKSSAKDGTDLVKNFWERHGIEQSALDIMDGSGLSPQNRVTTNALVTALQYARSRVWFSSFYNALPIYNGMHMKSGTIGGAKAYAGYHTSQNGTPYTFAIIINNYDSGAGSIVPEMYRILDVLK